MIGRLNLMRKKIILIFLAGLFLRLAYVLFVPQIDIARDSEKNTTIAENIVNGYGFSYKIGEPEVYWAPGYPYFIAIIYKIFGTGNNTAVRIVQSILSSLLILLVYAIGNKIFNSSIGLGAALITSLYPGFIGYSGLLLSQLLMAFLITLFIFLIIHFNFNIRLNIALGLIAGYGCIVRGEFILLWFILLLFSAFKNKTDKRTIGALISIFMVMCLFISVWTIRNYRLFGKVIPISVHYGDVMWYSTWKGEWLEYRAEEPYISIAKGLDPVHAAEAYFKSSLLNVKGHPFIYLKMCIKRLLRLWLSGHSNTFYFMTNGLLDYLKGKDYFIFFVKLIMFFMNLAIILLGFIGIRIAYTTKTTREAMHLQYISFPIFFIILFHFFIFATPRYAIPVMPLLILFTSYEILFIIRGLKPPRWQGRVDTLS